MGFPAAGSKHMCFCASGFLLRRSEICGPWAVDLESPWTCEQVIAVRWESELLLELGKKITDYMVMAGKTVLWTMQGIIACSNLISFSKFILDFVLNEIMDLFDLALIRAKQAGVRLAQ